MKIIERFLSRSTSYQLCSARRGQAAVLYALLTPIFLLLIGVTLDLGWYYINVSRLQNAADSAVVAGAQVILESDNKNFSDYKFATLVKSYPGDDEYLYNVFDISFEEVMDDSNSTAADYASKNLSRKASWMFEGDSYIMTDAWSIDDAGEVTMKPSIYKKGDELYYVIKLKENIRHFFLSGWFDTMNAPVTAVAMITKENINEDSQESSDKPQPISTKPTPIESTSARVLAEYEDEVIEERSNEIPRESGAGAEGGLPEGTNILTEMYKIEDHSAIRNWEWQHGANENTYRLLTGGVKDKSGNITGGSEKYNGNWNEYQDKRNDKKTVKYEEGDLYRTEIVGVYASSLDETKADTGSGRYAESELDSINLDFHPDLNSQNLTGKQFTEDWDIGYPTPEGKELKKLQNDRSSSGGYDLRIHSTFNFETPYTVRHESKFDKKTNPEDVLYVRIESEPILSLKFKPDHYVYSTVRQIILNINQSNMDSKYRPLMFFYSGPEKIDNNSHVRDSQPVILNLNADARVVLFAPNSPVVICGNQKHMQGFVIAKEFVRLTTEDDYIKNGSQYFDKEDPTKECFKIYENHENNNPTMFIDSKGNVQTKPLSENLGYYTRDPIYEDDLEKPLRTDVIKYPAYEKVYKMHTAFNIDKNDSNRTTSFYDSFQLFDEGNTTTGSLKRNIYTYLDAYTEEDKPNSVDMFFTKIRSSWVD